MTERYFNPAEQWIGELRGPIHGRLQTLRGMCTDERPHIEIDALLLEVDELVDCLSMFIAEHKERLSDA